MELTGNSASRWEQVSNKIGDIAFKTDKQREQLEKLITELVDLAGQIHLNQETLTKLSGIVYKEVFREESKMLNDDSDESATTAPKSSTELTQDAASKDIKPKQSDQLTTKKRGIQKETTTSRSHKTTQKIDQTAATEEAPLEKEQLQLLSEDGQHHE